MSHEHNHHEFVEGTPEERANKFIKSGILRGGSAIIQAVGGIAGNQPALVVEAAEEMTDAMTFGAAAIEARSDKKGVVAKARRMAISFAIGASSIASFEFGSELVGDKFSLNKPTEGLNFEHIDIKAATAAIALNSVVLFINRKGKDSKKTSDKFAYRDSLRDFVIPASVLGIAAVQAPHWAEYIFEAGGVSYGWYNTKQLYNGWKKPKK
jgi:Co/Zn/Cd efflux system component